MSLQLLAAKLHKKNDIHKLYVIFSENYFIFLLEELVHFLVYDDLLLEDVSPCFRRLNHLDALRVRASGVTRLQCCDRFLCHSSKPF